MSEIQKEPAYFEVTRHDPIILGGLREAPIYKKQGEVRAAIAQGGEKVETRLADGTLETTNTASEGDVIITNPGGEQYIIGAEKFKKRYQPKEGEDGVYEATGHCRAIDNPYGRPITMLASWGEMQNGAVDCIIADTFEPQTGTFGGNPYIIGRDQFEETYALVATE